jgi:hypothetical protein
MGIALTTIGAVSDERIVKCLLAMMTLDEVQVGLLGAFIGENSS